MILFYSKLPLSIFSFFIFLSHLNAFSMVWALEAQKKEWSGYLRPGFLAREGSTAGYMDYFLPLWQDKQRLLFMNPKVSLTDDDANEQNIGVGFRHLLWEDEWILGGNIFYDTRKSTFGNRFQQVGVGAEALSKWVDVRVNYYHPTSNGKRVESLDTYRFGETSLLRFAGFEEPLSGVDYEVGVLVPYVSEVLETRVYGGGYFYDSKKFRNVQGSRLRVEARPNKLLTLELKVDFDKDSGTNTSFGGYVSLPFEVGNIFRGKNPFAGWKEALRLGEGPRNVRERMAERVVRDLDIVSGAGATGESEEEAQIVFVDNRNDGDALEDGSKSHPHNTLAEALSNSRYGENVWVKVQEGDGTAVGYTGNFVLADGSVLWGSGYDGGFKGIKPTSGNPVLDGGGLGNVITLGDNNVVMGLTVQNGVRGIFGEDVVNPVVRNNTIQNNSQEGILFDMGGTTSTVIDVYDNTVTGNSGWAGIFGYIHEDANATINITNNTSSNNLDTGAPSYASGESSGRSGRGIRLDIDDNAVLDSINITHNNIFNNGFHAIVFASYEGSQLNEVNINSNHITGNTSGTGIWSQVSDHSVVQSISNLNNVLSNNSFGIFFSTPGNGHLNSALIKGNILDNSGSIFPSTTNSNPISIVISDNTVTNSNAGGITLSVQGQTTAIISNNTIVDASGFDGILLLATGGSLSASLSGNTITGSVLDGVDIGIGFVTPATYNIDLGGGSLGSSGNNSIFNNGGFDVNNSISAPIISAENNWWGTTNPEAGQFNGDVDFTPFLLSNPN